MAFFTELGQCIKYLRRKTHEKDITFYAEHGGYFPYFEGILQELVQAGDIPVVYITSDQNDPILTTPRGVSAYYVGKLLPYLFLLLNTRVCVMTMPDLDRFHLKRSIRSGIHYVYVFHSLISTHMQYRERAFDSYDSIFCAGPHHVEEIRAREIMKKMKPKNLIEAGYYRLERVYSAYHRKAESVHDISRPCVLVAPSWGAGNILESCGEEVVQVLLDAGYEVIVRPHPEMTRRSPEILQSLGEKFSQSPDFTMEMSIRTDDSLLRADVLVTDWSGIAFEYALGTGRPVLFINVPKKIHNPMYDELGIEPIEIRLRREMGAIIEPTNIAVLRETVERLIRERAWYQESLAELRNNNVFVFNQSSKVGADALRALLKS